MPERLEDTLDDVANLGTARIEFIAAVEILNLLCGIQEEAAATV